MQIGKLYLNVKALLGITEQSFYTLVKGVDIGMCRLEAWKLFEAEKEKLKFKAKPKKEESPE